MTAGQVSSLIVVVVFIFALFYARAYILKRMSGQTRGGFGRRNVEVLEQFHHGLITAEEAAELIQDRVSLAFMRMG